MPLYCQLDTHYSRLSLVLSLLGYDLRQLGILQLESAILYELSILTHVGNFYRGN
jgi:hypothetical protein